VVEGGTQLCARPCSTPPPSYWNPHYPCPFLLTSFNHRLNCILFQPYTPSIHPSYSIRGVYALLYMYIVPHEGYNTYTCTYVHLRKP
jgi:hypothetical protein